MNTLILAALLWGFRFCLALVLILSGLTALGLAWALTRHDRGEWVCCPRDDAAAPPRGSAGDME